MLRITKITDYGFVLLIHMGRQDPVLSHNARDLARATGIPLPTVSKILKQLARRKLLVSFRGIKGGYSLSRPAREVTAVDIIGALEGPVALTECQERSPSGCNLEVGCPVRKSWRAINRAILDALNRVTLADMAGVALEAGNGHEVVERPSVSQADPMETQARDGKPAAMESAAKPPGG